MIIILIAAAVVSGVTAVYAGESFADVIIIMTVVIINAVLGDATGIQTPVASEPSGVWYSLDGQRLAGKPTRQGVYICDGKKIVVK
jgi:hypothetical protein